jgi:hypothetical protein
VTLTRNRFSEERERINAVNAVKAVCFTGACIMLAVSWVFIIKAAIWLSTLL